MKTRIEIKANTENFDELLNMHIKSGYKVVNEATTPCYHGVVLQNKNHFVLIYKEGVKSERI